MSKLTKPAAGRAEFASGSQLLACPALGVPVWMAIYGGFHEGMGDEVEAKAAKLQEIGWKVYLEK
ncbi:hypothetical protein ACSS6W_008465 [Trichoderma asperelloides]